MDHLYILFIGSCIFLGLIPGPNVALIVANSIAHGPRYGLTSLAGSSAAMIPQLTLTVLGATTLLALMASAFEYLRWLGVAYLLYLGVKFWFEKEHNLSLDADKQKNALKNVFWSGFWVSATNPKTLLFMGAFLPQFINETAHILPQMTVLAITFVIIISLVDIGWALLASAARPILKRFARLRQRISGGFFIAAACGLALAKKP